MSYPRLIQPLVIEDNPETKKVYEAIFKDLGDRFGLAPSCYAFSYDEALAQLSLNKIFHTVILDLELPKAPRMPAANGLDLGLDLLSICAERDAYPIPSLLVVSGHVGKADQERLRYATESGFAHGRVLVKGDHDVLATEIARALEATARYCAVGIHLRDSGERKYPAVAPRDDDLLRRLVLDHVGAVGADLEWWSADASRVSPSSRLEWTKVLMGRILFDHGDRPSRPNFFKFMPASRGLHVIEAAQRMAHKLEHIKVNGVARSSNSALIVTEKVGRSEERPISLVEFLALEMVTVQEVSQCASQIVAQVDALGNHGAQTISLKELLWRFHDAERIRSAWERYAGPSLRERQKLSIDVADAFDRISASTELIRYDEQSFLHGDLHIGNIALDRTERGVEAYVFDAGGTEPSARSKDVAVLEVSALLHQVINDGDFFLICQALYGRGALVASGDRPEFSETVARNTYIYICSLRSAIESTIDPRIYALLALDYSLIQLSGMTFGTSESKVCDAMHSAVLAAYVAEWFEGFSSFGQ